MNLAFHPVGIYSVIYGFNPLRIELIHHCTLLSPATLSIKGATVVQKLAVQEARSGLRQMQYGDLFGKMLQVPTSQLVITICSLVEY